MVFDLEVVLCCCFSVVSFATVSILSMNRKSRAAAQGTGSVPWEPLKVARHLCISLRSVLALSLVPLPTCRSASGLGPCFSVSQRKPFYFCHLDVT